MLGYFIDISRCNPIALWLVVAGLLFSCAPSSKQEVPLFQAREELWLQENHIKSFTLDSTMTFKVLHVKCTQDSLGNHVFYYENRRNNSMHFFDFLSAKEKVRFIFPHQGPNSISSLGGACFINSDTLLLYDETRFSLSFLNTNDTSTVQLFRYADMLEELGASIHISTQNPPIRLGSWLHFSAFPYLYASEDRAFCEYPNNISVNLKTGAINSSNSYPKHYRGELWGDFAYVTHSCEGHGPFVVQSFAFDHHIYLTDHISQNTSIEVKSSYWGKAGIAPPKNASDDAVRREMVERTFYGAVLHDKYRKVYYRMVLHGIPFKSPTGEINSIENKPFSIMLLKEDFSVIGEQVFKGGKYDFRNWFVHPDGLFISNANEQNPELSEGKLDYTCFSFVR